VVGLFDGERELMIATEASAGKEFDVGEVHDQSTDIPYREMASLAARKGLFDDWKLLHLDGTEHEKWIRFFRNTTSASELQARKFLHCF
jgi:hypothetical protein